MKLVARVEDSAGEGGHPVAYRWEGELEPRKTNFPWLQVASGRICAPRFVPSDNGFGMELAGTMIGATGEYTFSGIVQRGADGRYHAVARVFDHPDPSVSLPSGTTPRHVVTIEGASLEGAKLLLEQALAARLGALDWVRWRSADA